MSFIEAPRFPEDISYGSSGGPVFNTTIRIVDSGFEYSNINWDNAKRKYNVATGVRTEENLYDLIQFFHLTRGKGHYYRYKDWMDYKSCAVNDAFAIDDQEFGLIEGVDGINSTFQLVKKYTLAGTTIVNNYLIRKPVISTLLVEVDGSAQTVGVDYTIVDADNGVITFQPGSIPANGLVLKWGGEFDIPSRFATDELNVTMEFYEHLSTSVPIVEVRV